VDQSLGCSFFWLHSFLSISFLVRHLVKCGPAGVRSVGVTTGKMRGKSAGVRGLKHYSMNEMTKCSRYGYWDS